MKELVVISGKGGTGKTIITCLTAVVDKQKCIGCGICVNTCPQGAINMQE